jgi:hypothetical protein
VKIRSAIANHRKAQMELTTRSGKVYPMPYAKLDPKPSAADRVRDVFVDPELGNEAVAYVLESGAEGTLHIDDALEYNEDPRYLGELFTHRLTAEVLKRIEGSGLSRRELARRLHTSLPQLYRLLDPTLPRKNVGQLISLLHILNCEVDVTVRERSPSP